MIPNNVSIRVRSNELLEFLYPMYQVVHQFSPLIEGGVIFDGDAKYLQMFRDNNISYIYTKGTPEYDLTVVENLLEFVYNKWDKKPPKYVSEYLDTLDYKKRPSDVEDIIKQVWVTGKCEIVENERIKSFYKSIASSGAKEIIISYLKLTAEMDGSKLFYQVQSYLKSTTKPDTVSSAWLHRLVDEFNHAERYKLLPKALYTYLYTNSGNDDIKMMKLLIDLSYKGRKY